MSKSRYVPQRGDVIELDFDPQTGHAQADRRPALVLSPTEYNRTVGLVVVCPITREQKGYPWEVVIEPNDFLSGVVLADQMKNLDWRGRHAQCICTAEAALLEEVVEKSMALLGPEDENEA